MSEEETPDASMPTICRSPSSGPIRLACAGFATFTHDLSDAVIAADESVRATVLAMTDADSTYEQPERVRFEVRRGVDADYRRAAEFVNVSDIRLVSIQHEYGIFDGTDGAHVLDFLAALRKPAIATLHTVLKNPTESQREIVLRMAERCERLVVMSELAVELLERSYGIPRSITEMIPHGIPDISAGERDAYKAAFGLAGRRVLLTFGLLSPAKGIDVVIRALPGLVERFPDLVYLIVGVTHPEVKRENGEEYRHSLKRLTESLNISDNVVFRNQFVDDAELCRYLQSGGRLHHSIPRRSADRERHARGSRWGRGRPSSRRRTGTRRSCSPGGAGGCSVSATSRG